MMRLGSIFILLILLVSPLRAATLYMGSGETYTNLQAAMAAMKAGDTLIIRDGTYTGTSNSITSSARPPRGSGWKDGEYSIIKAENDGGVIFDGGETNAMFNSQPSAENWYVQFEGIEWGNTVGGVLMMAVSHVKFLRCGFFDAIPADASGNVSLFRAHTGCSYILVEGCWAYGNGRYKFSAYQASHIIFRNCVARYDRHDNGSEPNPVGNFCSYTSSYVQFQNCISIDSDQSDYVVNVQYSDGSYVFPTTAGASSANAMINCIALNDNLMGTVITGYISGLTISNCVFVDNKPLLGRDGVGEELYSLRGESTQINRCTMIDGYSPTRILNMSDVHGSSSTSVKNSVLTQLLGTTTFLYDYSVGRDVEDYNCLHGNGGSGVGANDITTNPIYNASTNPTGGIKYPVRVETGSNNLDGQGEGGIDIGANCLYLVGTPGTLYGETGYATETATPMWPFPNEDLIKTKLAAYNDGGVSGARGFCATGKQLDGTSDITLTSYIWEYLGNQMPSDIYGVTATRSLNRVNLHRVNMH